MSEKATNSISPERRSRRTKRGTKHGRSEVQGLRGYTDGDLEMATMWIAYQADLLGKELPEPMKLRLGMLRLLSGAEPEMAREDQHQCVESFFYSNPLPEGLVDALVAEQAEPECRGIHRRALSQMALSLGDASLSQFVVH